MATKSKRQPKLTEKMALSKSAQQQRKPRKVVIPIPNVIQKDTIKSTKPIDRGIVISPKNTDRDTTKSPKNTDKEIIKSINTEKDLSKPNAQLSTKSMELKSTKSVTKVSPPESEQVEYYPNKLKRKIHDKKIVLKPKHNFKIVATTNKRKLCTPHKETKSPIRKSYTYYTHKPIETTTSLSVQEMVMMIDEASLSDEDFMEILSCPSPVWWEDPPHWTYVEDPICDITTEEYLQDDIDFEELEPEQLQINEITKKITQQSVNNTKTGAFIKKKQKLESILDNIAKKIDKNSNTPEIDDSIEQSSISTDDSLELIFNEDEILNTLENIKIPIEKDTSDTKNRIPSEMPPLTRKPGLKKPELSENTDFDSISDTNIRFISDDDFCSTNSDDSNFKNKCPKEKIDSNELKNNNINKNVPNKKAINDLSEYITVYKIIPEQSTTDNKTKPENKNKMDDIHVHGRLNNFFKKCKNNKRLKTSFTANSVNVKNLKIKTNSDVKTDDRNNRLKPCDCLQSLENKTACEKCCEKYVCNYCNFGTESLYAYKTHVLECNAGTKVASNNNVQLNQT